MKTFRFLGCLIFLACCIPASYAQDDDDMEEYDDRGQAVKCAVSIQYTDIITVTKNYHGYTGKAVTTNTHTLQSICNGYWDDEDFYISNADTRKTLQGSVTASSSEQSTSTSACADKTEKHNTTATIDLQQTTFSFRYEKRGDDDRSTFNFNPGDVGSIAGGGSSIKTCKECQNGCKSGETPYMREQVELIGANAVYYGTYSLQSDAGMAAQMMQMMGVNNNAAGLMMGKFTKTGPSSFMITQSIGYSETEGTTVTDHHRTVSIIISPDEGPKYEAFIEPVDLLTNYEKFIPLGPAITDDNIPEGYNYTGNNKEWGNSLTFQVKVYKKGTDTEYDEKTQVTWSLADISMYPGYCNNYPPKGQEDVKPDLRFVRELNTDNHLTSVSDDKAVSTMDKEEHLIVVTSLDYAAWGKLQADVTLENGTVLQAQYKEKETYSIIIPKDEDQNKIADQWEIDMRIEGKGPEWDDDQLPEKQRGNGDGYTLFEEYRGFKALGHNLREASRIKTKYQHFRSDPKHKDIFIYDENELFKTYYSPENPANLNWHYIQPEQMIFNGQGYDPQNRWVNFHKTDYHIGKQYAMHLVKRENAPGSNSVVGAGIFESEIPLYNDQTEPSVLMGWYIKLAEDLNGIPKNGNVCLNDPFENPLKCFYIIEVYQGTIESMCRQLNASAQQDIFQKMMASTIIHEIGHGIGISHHWKTGLANGSLVEEETMHGVLDCAMRYTSSAENRRPGQLYRDQKRFCKEGETYEEIGIISELENLDPAQIPRQSFPAHNCYGKIEVKTDP